MPSAPPASDSAAFASASASASDAAARTDRPASAPPPRAARGPHVSRPIDLSGMLVAALCCALWGGNAVAVKFAVPEIPALLCAGLRFAIALPMLALVCRIGGYPMLVRRDAWGLMGLHVAITVLQIGTFNWGTSLSLAGRASVFINVHPLVVAPLAWLLLGERVNVRGLLGLAAAVAGVVILVSEPLARGGPILGDLIVLFSGAVFGVQTIFQKRTFHRIPAPTMLLWQTLLGAPAFFAVSQIVEGGFAAAHFTRPAIAGLLYQGLMVSGVCFTVWMLLLHRYHAGQLATIAFLTPLFGITFGSLARGEPFTLALGLGGGLVGLGIYLSASGARVSAADAPTGEAVNPAIPPGTEAAAASEPEPGSEPADPLERPALGLPGDDAP